MLTQERLKQLVTYDPTTGLLTCAINRKGSRNKVGDVLGSATRNGHLEVQLDGQKHYIHRLAFLYMMGAMPRGVVDHINRNGSDNRWDNLRDVTQNENTHNQTRLAENNSTGFVGVHRWGEKYRAKINIGKKQMHLGTYDDPAVAAAAYTQAKAALQPVMEG